jgi:hypothetical protein
VTQFPFQVRFYWESVHNHFIIPNNRFSVGNCHTIKTFLLKPRIGWLIKSKQCTNRPFTFCFTQCRYIGKLL